MPQETCGQIHMLICVEQLSVNGSTCWSRLVGVNIHSIMHDQLLHAGEHFSAECGQCH